MSARITRTYRAIDSAGARLSDRRVSRDRAVSRRAFYEQFSNKQECFIATFDGIINRVLGRMRALVHCPYPLPLDGVPPLFTGSGLRPIDGPLGTVRDRLLNGIANRMLATGLPALNRARSEQGLRPLDHWAAQLLGVQVICVMTAPERGSSRGRLPANVRYVGPAFEPCAREWSSPWPETNTDPRVVVSFSTSYKNQQALAQRVLDALAGLPVGALLTAGPTLDTSRLCPPRTHAPWPSYRIEPCSRTRALVVTHADWQTVNAALADGVPLLCIPDGRDQPDNAARVLLASAGMRVRKQTSPPQAPHGDRRGARRPGAQARRKRDGRCAGPQRRRTRGRRAS
jgi:UDP:flavonoid glycosyltransferase YjiC (YdhE family)